MHDPAMHFSLPIRSGRPLLACWLLVALAGAGGRGAAAASGADAANPDAAGAAATASAAAQGATISRGVVLYAKYCALCHGPEAKGYVADNAPSLVTREFLSSADDTFLVNSIALGRPDTAMAAYGKESGGPLSNEEIEDIVAFLRSHGAVAYQAPEKHAAGSARNGAKIYADNCVKCHGDRRTGGDAVHLANTTFLGLASDDFLYESIARGRDGTPMKAFGNELEPQQIADVVAYLRTWSVGPPQALIRPHSSTEGPVVLNPDGKPPEFSLREDRFVPAADVKHAIEDKRRMVVIDARVSSDYDREHIPGAISVPYYSLDALNRVPNDGTWVVAYCACPHHASGVVVDELRKRGYAHTAVIDEGILVWKERGYPIDGSDTAATHDGT
jgi:cbb3-type cytochrome c oxidase subunit III